MKKIILLACCMVLFSIGVCNADSDIDKLKGCWSYKYGSIKGKEEIGDNYIKNLKNGDKFELVFEENDTHIIMKEYVPLFNDFEILYINKASITDTSFRRSKKASSPEDGLKLTRIQCPK